MKTLLFLSLLVLLMQNGFCVPSETAFQEVEEDNVIQEDEFLVPGPDDSPVPAAVASDDEKDDKSPTAPVKNDDDDTSPIDETELQDALETEESNEEASTEAVAKSQGIHLTLTPGKDLVITLSDSGRGVAYTRFGRTACRAGAQRVYSGYAAGGYYNQHGNGANLLCMPRDPQYLSTITPSLQSYLYGSEYETANRILSGTNNFNVPCAVCYVPNKSSKIMLPGKVSCPRTWTREFYGYLMAERHNHARSAQYECIDYRAQVIPGSGSNRNGALLYFVQAVCNYGLPCGPYRANRAITCSVCTK